MRLKVLLVTFDLYRKVGGGETVYRKIVSLSPEIDFFYLQDSEGQQVTHPDNITPIPLKPTRTIDVLVPPPFPNYRRLALTQADRIASSVAGMEFDIVDFGDWYNFGSFLRDAFHHHHVKVGRIVMALHGNISTSVALQWGAGDNKVLELEILERDQFESADGLYGISPRYIEAWRSVINREIHFINPLNFVQATSVDLTGKLQDCQENAPNLYCIGRMERRKGNDLFVEIVRWLKKGSYGKAAHIGDQVIACDGASSQYLLNQMAKIRNVEIGFSPALTRDALEKVYKEKSIVILPTRYDSLNLVALEALFAGCPVVLSQEAGVCSFLDQEFPEVPYIKIDFKNFYDVITKIESLIEDYSNYRNNLEQALRSISGRLNANFNILSVYRSIMDAPPRQSSKSYPQLTYSVEFKHPYFYYRYLARMVVPERYYSNVRCLVFQSLLKLKTGLQLTRYINDVRLLRCLISCRRVALGLPHVSSTPEWNKDLLLDKLKIIYHLTSRNPLYRCNYWQEIARIERLLGHDMIAVTYELRLLRLLECDVFGVLPNVAATLKTHGLLQEAAAAQALYGNSEKAEENVYAYLKDAWTRNLINHEKPFERMIDRRQGLPKVAVIVSLYNAGSKLKFFLTAMLQQTLIRHDPTLVEFILVDSASPSNEVEVVEAFWRDTPLNAIYVRSANRETIQAAWNRGIHIAKAPYLVFLGADETVYPNAFEVLTSLLDQKPDVDWVMGSSLVTEVDPQGVYKNDVMTYDRSGGTKDHVYLETCYLSYVGGMYRKSIHDRCGYYDETFTGAGDTEFKNRVLPHINVMLIPEILGLFLNYPEERTTASSRAEIEDLRAWYIHRTPGGVRYAFERRSLRDVEVALFTALGYRKSFCRHTSSDIEYASYLAHYLLKRGSMASYLPKLAQDLEEMLAILRSLELVRRYPGTLRSLKRYVESWIKFKRYQKSHATLLPPEVVSLYGLYNDNRYEQHSWLWKSTSSK